MSNDMSLFYSSNHLPTVWKKVLKSFSNEKKRMNKRFECKLNEKVLSYTNAYNESESGSLIKHILYFLCKPISFTGVTE